MNGQKERLMVLDMIAEGKITARRQRNFSRPWMRQKTRLRLARARLASITFISAVISFESLH